MSTDKNRTTRFISSTRRSEPVPTSFPTELPPKTIIGSNVKVQITNIADVPAKIDTGADSSAVWASHIDVTPEGVLEFCLFAPESPFYTGELLRTRNYQAVCVRSSNGSEQIRYRTHLPLTIANRRIRTSFSLADRSRNQFPILIGSRTLRNRFIVDVSQSASTPAPNPRTPSLNLELARDPYRFHQRYILKNAPRRLKGNGII